MKSIRLSLMLYFLILLGLALGAGAILAYQNTERIVEAKEALRRDLLQRDYEKECDRELARLNRALLSQAEKLAGQAQFQYQWSRERLPVLSPFGRLSVALLPNGYLAPAVWKEKVGIRAPLFDVSRNQHLRTTEIQFNEDALQPLDSPPVVEYFQINGEGGSMWRSHSMGERVFPFDQQVFESFQLLEHRFDETELNSGLRVRRIMLKAPVAKVRFLPPPRPPPGEKPAMPRPDFPRRPAAPEPQERATFPLFIQCAAETTQRDVALAQHKKDLDNALAELKAESSATLSSLRNQLLLISLATFAATLLGGFWLVRLGLSPLHRLSEAVSRVSAKDFKLPLDEAPMPNELRPIVERLTQTLDLLKRTFAREKQAAADISHELRTPLAALLTTLEVGLRKTRTPEEYRELLADCHATGQQMSQLVERLLILARLDAGVDTLRPREVDVPNLVEQCATMVRPLAEARGLDLIVQRNGPAQATTDPDKLREVLTNLLHNAIEYNRPQGKVEVSVEKQNGYLHLEVRDTGIGIAPGAREHIFERFFRADPARQADGLHAGLGLAIVKGYVDLIGGKITVESTEGQGSTFRLELPIQ